MRMETLDLAIDKICPTGHSEKSIQMIMGLIS